MKVAIYPGSFDPITVGHMDIVERATMLFDKVIISVADTDMKNPLFSSEERLDLVSSIYADNEKIEVVAFKKKLRVLHAYVLSNGLKRLKIAYFIFLKTYVWLE